MSAFHNNPFFYDDIVYKNFFKSFRKLKKICDIKNFFTPKLMNHKVYYQNSSPITWNSESHKLAASCAALWAALSLKLNFGCSWAYKLELEAQGLRGKRSSRSASSSGFWAWSSAHFKLTLKIISKMDFSQNFTKIFNLQMTRKLLFGTIWANLT